MRNVRRLSPVSVDVCRIATHTFRGGTIFHWCAKCATQPGKQPESTELSAAYPQLQLRESARSDSDLLRTNPQAAAGKNKEAAECENSYSSSSARRTGIRRSLPSRPILVSASTVPSGTVDWLRALLTVITPTLISRAIARSDICGLAAIASAARRPPACRARRSRRRHRRSLRRQSSRFQTFDVTGLS
jgi:hypothetical protein